MSYAQAAAKGPKQSPEEVRILVKTPNHNGRDSFNTNRSPGVSTQHLPCSRRNPYDKSRAHETRFCQNEGGVKHLGRADLPISEPSPASQKTLFQSLT